MICGMYTLMREKRGAEVIDRQNAGLQMPGIYEGTNGGTDPPFELYADVLATVDDCQRRVYDAETLERRH